MVVSHLLIHNEVILHLYILFHTVVAIQGISYYHSFNYSFSEFCLKESTKNVQVLFLSSTLNSHFTMAIEAMEVSFFFSFFIHLAWFSYHV